MAREYDTYVNNRNSLELNKDVEIIVRDLTPGSRKYEARVVRARVFKESSDERDKLWLRYPTGTRDPEPWGITIVQELGEGPR